MEKCSSGRATPTPSEKHQRKMREVSDTLLYNTLCFLIGRLHSEGRTYLSHPPYPSQNASAIILLPFCCAIYLSFIYIGSTPVYLFYENLLVLSDLFWCDVFLDLLLELLNCSINVLHFIYMLLVWPFKFTNSSFWYFCLVWGSVMYHQLLLIP